MKIYLDVCCLNRPYDDQTDDKIHLESEAILIILGHIENKDWVWFKSDVVDYEIEETPNMDRKIRVKKMTRFATKNIKLNSKVLERGDELKRLGIKTFDALHIASAEIGKADILLSTDKKLVSLGTKNAKKINVIIKNPLIWLREVLL